jgi:hypothetical protein
MHRFFLVTVIKLAISGRDRLTHSPYSRNSLIPCCFRWFSELRELCESSQYRIEMRAFWVEFTQDFAAHGSK